MKKALTLVAVLLTTIATAQLKEVKIEEGYVVYTAKEGDVEVTLTLRSDAPDAETLSTIIKNANAGIKVTLKSSRSFVPLLYSYKFRPNKKGKTKKDKHSLHVTYEATNSYGAPVEKMLFLVFNAKLTETVGSVLARS
tara:strand:- start:119 stop:532 length:414 start_codon:yes stop_codon:yes gene_type:complete